MDRIEATVVGKLTPDSPLTSFCAAELLSMLRQSLIAGVPQLGVEKAALREATIRRFRTLNARRHVDTMSFTKTPNQVAERISKLGVFHDPVTGLRVRLTGPTYAARGNSGNRRMFYLELSGLEDDSTAMRRTEGHLPAVERIAGPTRGAHAPNANHDSATANPPTQKTILPPLGRPVVLLHVVREGEMHVSGEDAAKWKLSPEEFVKMEMREALAASGIIAAVEVNGGVELLSEFIRVDETGANKYHSVADADVRLPERIRVTELPTVLAVLGVEMNVTRVEFQFTPPDPLAVWVAALKTIGGVEPQPVAIVDDLPDRYGRLIPYRKFWGSGPGKTTYVAELCADRIAVRFDADSAVALSDAMRDFPLRTFFRERLGFNVDC